MKKKTLALLLAASMVLSLAACGGDKGGSDNASPAPSQASGAAPAASGSSTTKEPYDLKEIKVTVNGNFVTERGSGMEEWEAKFEELTGVKITFTKMDHQSYPEAVGRQFAGGDMPDVVLMLGDMYAQYVPTGYLWDMTDAYENLPYKSRIVGTSVNEGLKRNGRLYGFASGSGNGCVTYVKTQWLENVGLKGEDIKDWDSYYDMLVKFTTEDPDGNGKKGDTYGVCGAGFMAKEAPWVMYLPEFWQDAYPAIYQKDGKWIDGFQEDNVKDAILRLKKAYDDGVLYPETLSYGTGDCRNLWLSADQAGSFGVFTYWAGNWYDSLSTRLAKAGLDDRVTMLKPIKEVGAYIDREPWAWVIIDDQDGDDSREQAIFDTFIGTMMDGDKVQTLWTYGVEDYHWTTKAESFVLTSTDKEGKKTETPKEYKEGEFHMKPVIDKTNPGVYASQHGKLNIDDLLSIAPLTNGFSNAEARAYEGQKFFFDNCVAAPPAPSCETYTENAGTIMDAALKVLSDVIVNGVDVDKAMETYKSSVGSIVDQCLDELNAQ